MTDSPQLFGFIWNKQCLHLHHLKLWQSKLYINWAGVCSLLCRVVSFSPKVAVSHKSGWMCKTLPPPQTERIRFLLFSHWKQWLGGCLFCPAYANVAEPLPTAPQLFLLGADRTSSAEKKKNHTRSQTVRQTRTPYECCRWYDVSWAGDSRSSRGRWPCKLTSRNNPSPRAPGAGSSCHSLGCMIDTYGGQEIMHFHTLH